MKNVQIVGADYKQAYEIIDDLIEVIRSQGMFVYEDPMTKGSDYINYIISEEELSPVEQLEASGGVEDYYMELKEQAMNELGYTEEEMEKDSIEDEVNRYADNLFFKEFGVDFQDIEV